MALYVDAREEEQHHWVKEILKEGVDARIGASLPTDFLWSCPTGVVIVERKTWPDFVDSFTTSGGVDGGNRLVGQLIGGPKSTALAVLLLEGPMPAYVTLGGKIIDANSMDDASVSLQWQFGVILIHSHNHDHTPSRIAAFYRYTQKEDHKSLLRPTPPIPEADIYLDPAFRKKIAAFMTIPQFGEKAALVLAEKTASPKAAANLTQDEILVIPGMGKVRARNFVEFWNKW